MAILIPSKYYNYFTRARIHTRTHLISFIWTWITGQCLLLFLMPNHFWKNELRFLEPDIFSFHFLASGLKDLGKFLAILINISFFFFFSNFLFIIICIFISFLSNLLNLPNLICYLYLLSLVWYMVSSVRIVSIKLLSVVMLFKVTLLSQQSDQTNLLKIHIF